MKVYMVGLITTVYLLQNSTKEIYKKKKTTLHMYMFTYNLTKNYLKTIT